MSSRQWRQSRQSVHLAGEQQYAENGLTMVNKFTKELHDSLGSELHCDSGVFTMLDPEKPSNFSISILL